MFASLSRFGVGISLYHHHARLINLVTLSLGLLCLPSLILLAAFGDHANEHPRASVWGLVSLGSAPRPWPTLFSPCVDSHCMPSFWAGLQASVVNLFVFVFARNFHRLSQRVMREKWGKSTSPARYTLVVRGSSDSEGIKRLMETFGRIVAFSAPNPDIPIHFVTFDRSETADSALLILRHRTVWDRWHGRYLVDNGKSSLSVSIAPDPKDLKVENLGYPLLKRVTIQLVLLSVAFLLMLITLGLMQLVNFAISRDQIGSHLGALVLALMNKLLAFTIRKLLLKLGHHETITSYLSQVTAFSVLFEVLNAVLSTFLYASNWKPLDLGTDWFLSVGVFLSEVVLYSSLTRIIWSILAPFVFPKLRKRMYTLDIATAYAGDLKILVLSVLFCVPFPWLPLWAALFLFLTRMVERAALVYFPVSVPRVGSVGHQFLPSLLHVVAFVASLASFFFFLISGLDFSNGGLEILQNQYAREIANFTCYFDEQGVFICPWAQGKVSLTGGLPAALHAASAAILILAHIYTWILIVRFVVGSVWVVSLVRFCRPSSSASDPTLPHYSDLLAMGKVPPDPYSQDTPSAETSDVEVVQALAEEEEEEEEELAEVSADQAAVPLLAPRASRATRVGRSAAEQGGTARFAVVQFGIAAVGGMLFGWQVSRSERMGGIQLSVMGFAGGFWSLFLSIAFGWRTKTPKLIFGGLVQLGTGLVLAVGISASAIALFLAKGEWEGEPLVPVILAGCVVVSILLGPLVFLFWGQKKPLLRDVLSIAIVLVATYGSIVIQGPRWVLWRGLVVGSGLLVAYFGVFVLVWRKSADAWIGLGCMWACWILGSVGQVAAAGPQYGPEWAAFASSPVHFWRLVSAGIGLASCMNALVHIAKWVRAPQVPLAVGFALVIVFAGIPLVLEHAGMVWFGFAVVASVGAGISGVLRVGVV